MTVKDNYVATEEERRRAAYISNVIDRQGRTRAWLATQMGLSYSYVHKMLTGARELPERHFQKMADILGVPGIADTVVSVTVHGLVIFLPAEATKLEIGSDSWKFFVEQAWKEAWIRENRQEVLHAAAARAWDSYEATTRSIGGPA